MKPKPVRTADRPAYPTRTELLRDANVLDGHLPRGWRKARGFAAALAALLAANVVGCGGTPAPPPQNGPAPTGRSSERIISEASFWIRSIFRKSRPPTHTAGVMYAVPVRYSEPEAIQIVEEVDSQNTN